MAWFDNPNKELNRLNQRLLAEEEPEEYEEYDDDYEEEPYDEEEDIPSFMKGSAFRGLDIRNRGQELLEEEEDDWDGNDDEPYAVFFETRRERRRRIRKEKKERRKGRNKTLRLSMLVLLETLILLGILIWWVMNRWPL